LRKNDKKSDSNGPLLCCNIGRAVHVGRRNRKRLGTKKLGVTGVNAKARVHVLEVRKKLS